MTATSEEQPTVTVVCIAGMHRSGTSMIARMLHTCGMYLGESQYFSPPMRSNSEGHWEHQRFLEIDDLILAALGAGWDHPPSNPWDSTDRRLGPLREQASALIAQYDGYPVWGWKDPRSSLVQPFWRSLIPGLKTIILVRNPLDVARSLAQRGASSPAFSFHLWEEYYRSLLRDCPNDARLAVGYDECLRNPRRQLVRLLDYLGLPVPPERLASASAQPRGTLRHSAHTVVDLANAGASSDILSLFERLSIESGAGVKSVGLPGVAEPANVLRLPDDRSWLRRHIAYPARRAIRRAVGVDWIMRWQEEQLDDLRQQLAERIRWEKHLTLADQPSSQETGDVD